MATATQHYDTVNQIIRYESGEMDDEEVVDFFQELVKSGIVWHLQGSYQRTALDMLKHGVIHAPAWFKKGGGQ